MVTSANISRRLLTILILPILFVALFSGCGGASDTGGQDQGSASMRVNDPDPKSLAAIDRIESQVWNESRDAVRDSLGSNAEEMFARLDRARIAAAGNMQAGIRQKSQGGAVSSIAPARLPSGNNLASSRIPMKMQQGVSASALLSMMAATPLMLSQMQDGTKGGENSSSNDGVNTKTNFKVTKSGRKMSGDFEMTLSTTESDGSTLTEKVTGKIELDVCPDQQGDVPLTYSAHLESQASGPGGGRNFQMDLSASATGHVNDDARLTGADTDGKVGASAQTPATGSGSGSNNYVEYRNTQTVTGVGSGDTRADGSVEQTRAAGDTNQAMDQDVKNVSQDLTVDLALQILAMAEALWTDGYCVEVIAEGVDDANEVEKSETKQFTGKVRHKFEGGELKVFGLQGTLSGEKELKPTEKKEAPVSYTYKAPDEEDKTATVLLETRSRRGAAKKAITFRTKKKKAYTASGGRLKVSGTICSLEKPFTLTGTADNGLAYTLTFSPASSTAGSMSYTGGGGGCQESASGAYTVSLSEDGGTGTITINVSGSVSCAGVGGGFSGRSDTFNITKAPPGTCSTS